MRRSAERQPAKAWVCPPTAHQEGTPSPRLDRLLLLGVVLLAVLVYANSAGNGFTLDDVSLVPENPLIRSLRGIPTLFRSDYWAPEIESGLYRPIVTTSQALTYALAGDGPAPYHVVNIALHALNCALAVALFRRLSADRLAIAAAACFFAAHAVHSEAVANVAGRAELLCAFFFLLSLLAYLAARRSRLLYAGSLAAYALALLSKETAITLLGAIVLYDFIYEGAERESRPLHRLWRLVRARFAPRYAGYLALALVYLAVRYLWLEIGDPRAGTLRLDNPLLHLDQPWRLISTLKVLFLYLWLLIFPLSLSYDYSYNQISLLASPRDPAVFLVLGLAALALGFVLRSYRRSKALFHAIGFALVTFSIVSNLGVGIGTIMAERLLYIPSIGFCLAAAIGLRLVLARSFISPRAGPAIFVGIFAVVVGLNGWRAVVRNRDWESDQTLLIHDLSVSPGSAKVRSNAAAIMILDGRLEEAVAHLEEAIAIDPTYHQPRVHLGDALIRLGREEEAIEVYEALVKMNTGEGKVWNNLGFLLVDRGIDVERGLRLVEQAVELDPENPAFLDSLGWAYYKTGRLGEARELVRKSLEIGGEEEGAEQRVAHLEEIERALEEARGRASEPGSGVSSSPGR